jgi:tripartite-type tricarboxylate transporter receptor subunit TctC
MHRNKSASFFALLRTFTVAVVCFALIATGAAHAAYPDKPIRLVIGYAPGGTGDSLTRIIAEKLGAKLGQTIVVENRPGAGGMIGTGYVAKADPDGYTLIFASIGVALYPYLNENVPYDVKKDLEPIIQVVSAPNFLAVNANSTIKSAADLIAAAKRAPGKMTYGTPGTGSTPFLSMQLFQKMTGTQFLHVPYKGSLPAVSDVLAGNIDMVFDNAALPMIKAGKLRPLAVSTPKRTEAAPEIPTVAELGYPEFSVSSWYGVMAPSGTPAPILDMLNAKLREVLAMPEVLKVFRDMGVDATPGSREQFRTYINSELDSWGKLIKSLPPEQK